MKKLYETICGENSREFRGRFFWYIMGLTNLLGPFLWAEKKLACYIVKIVTARRREYF